MKHDTVILDLDGTLVDSVYQHVLAWQLAFRDVGLRIRGVDVHAAIGMGGDKLVAHVAGDSAEWAVGDQVREAHDEQLRAFLPTLEEVDGASELLERLASSHRLVLASYGEEEVTHARLTHRSRAPHLLAIV